MQFDTLVLSGASSKGFLTLGALQSAHDSGLLDSVTNFIGTSAGGMICFLLAIGYTPVEILVYICSHKILDRMKQLDIPEMLRMKGALPFSIISDALIEMTLSKTGYIPTLLELKEKFGKTLICVTYNKTDRLSEHISYKTHPDLSVLVALRMTANLPLVFPNYNYDGKIYLDGGICDNFPIDVGESVGEKVLGIMVDSKRETTDVSKEETILDFLLDLLFVPSELYLERKIQNVSPNSVIVRLHCELSFLNFDLSHKVILDLFSQGYDQMRQTENKLKDGSDLKEANLGVLEPVFLSSGSEGSCVGKPNPSHDNQISRDSSSDTPRAELTI